MAKLCTLLMLLVLATSVHAYDEAVWLESVDGFYAPDTLLTGVPITFHIHASCGIEGHAGIINGFRVFSSDGAVWDTTFADTGALGGTEFDLACFVNYYSITGSGADTIGFGGAEIFGTGMPPDFLGPLLHISIGPIPDSSHGCTVCLDSSFYPPSNTWAWGGPSIQPTWGGPHCFAVVALDADGDGLDAIKCLGADQQYRVSAGCH